MLLARATTDASSRRWASITCAVLVVVTGLSQAQAHGISEASRATMADGGILAYIWLGAEHMLTGYDHLLFLFGVLFFLTGFRDILRFITAFTVGHCITLLGATLAGVTANAYLVDAVIALSVIYKGFENLDGFNKWFGKAAPNLLGVVFIFGLIHGFGLSTRLQELTLGESGMVGRILAFNLGVELGQIAALAVILVLFTRWRSHRSFDRFGTVANGGLVLAGVALFAFQIVGYVSDSGHHDSHAAAEVGQGGEHGHDHGDEHGHDHGDEHGHDHGDEHGHDDKETVIVNCAWQGARSLWKDRPALDASQPGAAVRIVNPVDTQYTSHAEIIIKDKHKTVFFGTVSVLAPETVGKDSGHLIVSTAPGRLDFLTDALRASDLTGDVWLAVGDNLETEPTNATQMWCKIRL